MLRDGKQQPEYARFKVTMNRSSIVEITESKLGLWYASQQDSIAEVGLGVDKLKADAHKFGDRLKQQTALFLSDWLDEQGL